MIKGEFFFINDRDLWPFNFSFTLSNSLFFTVFFERVLYARLCHSPLRIITNRPRLGPQSSHTANHPPTHRSRNLLHHTARSDSSPELRKVVDSSAGRVKFAKLDVTDKASAKQAATEVEHTLGKQLGSRCPHQQCWDHELDPGGYRHHVSATYNLSLDHFCVWEGAS